MDKDRIEGRAKEAKGSVTEAIGKIIGDGSTQARGAADKVEGKAQAAAGRGADKMKAPFGR